MEIAVAKGNLPKENINKENSMEQKPRTITITEALVELKTLAQRMETRLAAITATTYEVGGKLPNGKTKEEFAADAQSNYDSYKTMMDLRSRIKAAIFLSNSTTLVTVAGATMTVTEAIERKANAQHISALANTITKQYYNSSKEVAAINQQVERDIITQTVNTEKNDATTEFCKNMRIMRQASIVDPLGVINVAEGLLESNTRFLAEVDVVLTISNSTTTITV